MMYTEIQPDVVLMLTVDYRQPKGSLATVVRIDKTGDGQWLAPTSKRRGESDHSAAPIIQLALPKVRRGNAKLEFNDFAVLYRTIPKAQESHLASAVREVLDAPSMVMTFDVLAKKFHGLQGMIGSLEDVVDEKVPLGELYDVAVSFKGNIDDFVQTMERALERARQSNAGKDDVGGVALLIYFKSKGLQWHPVILTTCNTFHTARLRRKTNDDCSMLP